MRILQLSTFDVRYGAAIAARRLHEALLEHGVSSDLLVSEVRSDSSRAHSAEAGRGQLTARARHYLDRLPLRLYAKFHGSAFSTGWMPSPIAGHVDRLGPDVVHLHWCQRDFVPTTVLPRLAHPLVWTFHDMWAFTGGCHYTDGCERYLQECGRCPILHSGHESDLSRWLWRQKRGAYRRLQRSLQVICPSHWMAGLARQAPLLEGVPVHVVPNPVNARLFQPIDKNAARRLLGLPEEGRLLLMGAAFTYDPRKGADLLEAALQHYAQPGADALGLVTLGVHAGKIAAKKDGLTTWNMGFLHDEVSLCALYNAVDVVALPSRQENLSNTLAEALSCGIPCLAFAIGGNGDLITHQVNGYLARPGDTADMAAGLAWILRNLGDEHRAAIAKAAHANLSYEALVPAFLKIYHGAHTRG
ncbi:MAG: glycosyltransferase [Verrucomicrobiota bacterium]